MKDIKFKSTPENYRKEYLGLKPNTVRKFDTEKRKNSREKALNEWINNKITNLSITIINTETGESLSREVKDVTKWNGFYIISWKEFGDDKE